MTENVVTVKGRQVQKHDIEANWIKAGKAANPFIPLKGEIIVYDSEIDNEGNTLELPEGRKVAYNYTRQKIGDGIHNVNTLPFSSQDKLPTNNSGSSNRIWVATRLNGGKYLPIGTVRFNGVPILQSAESPIITNIANLIPEANTTENPFKQNLEDKYYATLARVAELYIMPGDDKTITHAYKDYIKASVDDQSVTFYWTYPYYFKRFSAETHTNGPDKATASGPNVGIVTVENYFKKWRNNEINYIANESSDAKATRISNYQAYLKNYYAFNVCGIGSATDSVKPVFSFFNATDNEEPFSQTLSTRDGGGHVSVEAAEKAFQAINLRQLEDLTGGDWSHYTNPDHNDYNKSIKDIVTEEYTAADEKLTSAYKAADTSLKTELTNAYKAADSAISKKITNSNNIQAEANYQVSGTINWSAGEGESGWYLIAAYSNAVHHSCMFNIQASLGYVSLCTFIVDVHEKNGVNTSIQILNASNRTNQPDTPGIYLIDKIGVVADQSLGRTGLYAHIKSGSHISKKGVLTTTCTNITSARKWQLQTCANTETDLFTDFKNGVYGATNSLSKFIDDATGLGDDIINGTTCVRNVTIKDIQANTPATEAYVDSSVEGLATEKDIQDVQDVVASLGVDALKTQVNNLESNLNTAQNKISTLQESPKAIEFISGNVGYANSYSLEGDASIIKINLNWYSDSYYESYADNREFILYKIHNAWEIAGDFPANNPDYVQFHYFESYLGDTLIISTRDIDVQGGCFLDTSFTPIGLYRSFDVNNTDFPRAYSAVKIVAREIEDLSQKITNLDNAFTKVVTEEVTKELIGSSTFALNNKQVTEVILNSLELLNPEQLNIIPPSKAVITPVSAYGTVEGTDWGSPRTETIDTIEVPPHVYTSDGKIDFDYRHLYDWVDDSSVEFDKPTASWRNVYIPAGTYYVKADMGYNYEYTWDSETGEEVSVGGLSFKNLATNNIIKTRFWDTVTITTSGYYDVYPTGISETDEGPTHVTQHTLYFIMCKADNLEQALYKMMPSKINNIVLPTDLVDFIVNHAIYKVDFLNKKAYDVYAFEHDISDKLSGTLSYSVAENSNLTFNTSAQLKISISYSDLIEVVSKAQVDILIADAVAKAMAEVEERILGKFDGKCVLCCN